MNIAHELLMAAVADERNEIDERLYLEVYDTTKSRTKKRARAKAR